MLSQSTLKKATSLVKKGLVKRSDENPEHEFYVASSSGGFYNVKRLKDNKKFDFYCDCNGWKFNQDCSHCQAVREFEKGGN